MHLRMPPGVLPALLMSFLFIGVNNTLATTSILEQTVKNFQTGPGVSFTQIVSCADLSGNIGEITMSLAGLISPNIPLRVKLVKDGESPNSPSVQSRKSDLGYTGSVGVQSDVIFIFPQPIDVAGDLCNGVSRVFIVLHAEGFSFPNDAVYIYGSDSNVYLGGAPDNSFYAGDYYFIVSEYSLQNTTPVLDVIGNHTIAEGQELSFILSATDSENDPLAYTASNLPIGATFNPATRIFSWTPDYDDAGTYVGIVFTATDNGNPQLSDSETIEIVVTNTNRAPVLSAIGNQTVSENQNLSFTLSASDPDGDTLTYSASNLPAGAIFNPTTQTFSWTPGYTDAGNYENIEFTVTDSGSPMELAVELITITVGDVNRAPVFVSPGAQEVLENDLLMFALSATDPDGDAIVLSATGLPVGASFNTATGIFAWTPTLSQAGVYTVTFSATDNGAPVEVGTIDVAITVGDNPTPVEQAENLIGDVINLDLPTNVENSYMANLQKVATFIEEGKIQPAINQLNAFISKVNQDYVQGILALQERNDLVAAAEALIEDLD